MSKHNANETNHKVLVVGLGQLGLPVAAYIKHRGFDVYGYDISSSAMERAERTHRIRRATDFGGFGVYILCVSTHQPENMFEPQVDGLLSIVNRISTESQEGALVIIESTIPKGTSRKICDMIGHRLHVVHAPHRWYAQEEHEHGVNQPRVMGGVHDCCVRMAMQFYTGKRAGGNGGSRFHKNLGIPMMPLSQVELAELTKIIENSHRYLQIAFAEDLYMYCEANGLDFRELRNGLNTKWNVNILEPRQGIGGHCLPKDTKMFLNSSNAIRSKIISAAMDVDADYRRYCVKEMRVANAVARPMDAPAQ